MSGDVAPPVEGSVRPMSTAPNGGRPGAFGGEPSDGFTGEPADSGPDNELARQRLDGPPYKVGSHWRWTGVPGSPKLKARRPARP